MSVHKKLQNAWFTIVLFGFIFIGTFRVFHNPSKTHELQENKIKKVSDRGERQLKQALEEHMTLKQTPVGEKETLRQDHVTSKHVTKSLLDMNLIDVPEVSDHVLLFNRVPKAGSEMLVLLLQWLQGVNGFRHNRLPNGHRRKLDVTEQEELVEEMTRITRDEAIPVSFDRHVYFINFTSFHKQFPIYINLVRDPVDKAVSRFYYGRVTPNPLNPDIVYSSRTARRPKRLTTGSFEQCVLSSDPECTYIDGRSYDLAIPYFCGQDKRCTVLNNNWALRRAKKNVEKYFSVVGVLEELNATLSVLEHNVPLYFKGVQNMYFQELMQPHKNLNRKRPRDVVENVRSRVKERMVTEYDFYLWLRARLMDQYKKIRGE